MLKIAHSASSTENRKPQWSLVMLGLLLLSACSRATESPAAVMGDRYFRFDAGRCGWDGGAVPTNLAPLWSYKGNDEGFLSSPLVAGGRVYVGTYLQDITAAYGAVVCLDAVTGAVIWRTEQIGGEFPKAFFSSPALTADGKSLLIGQGLHVDADSSLHCFDAATGALRWRIKTPMHIEGSPAVHGDLVVAGVGAIENDQKQTPADQPGFVLAVRISDGKERWRFTLTDPESSPAIGDDGTVYIGSGVNGNAVVALRSDSDDDLRAQKVDRLRWKTPTPFPATGAITLAGDMLLIGCGNGDYVESDPNPVGAVLALDRATGAVRWKTELPDSVLGPIAARDGVAICPVRNGLVVVLDLATGAERWRIEPDPEQAVLAGTAYAGHLVYAVTKNGMLHVLDAAKQGATVQQVPLYEDGNPGTGGLSVSSPMIVGGRLYVGSENGGLRCFHGAVAP